MIKTVKAVALTVLVGAFPAVHAAEQIFEFVGKVTTSSVVGANIGDLVTGTFRYDPDAATDTTVVGPPSSRVGIGLYAFNSPGSSLLSAQIGVHSVTSSALEMTVYDNILGGGAGDSVEISSGGSATVNGTNLAGASVGLLLTTDPGQTQVVESTDVPTSYDVNAFNFYGPESSVGWLDLGQGPNGEQVWFSISNITPVPEPDVGVLTLLGMGALGMWAGRRRFRR